MFQFARYCMKKLNTKHFFYTQELALFMSDEDKMVKDKNIPDEITT